MKTLICMAIYDTEDNNRSQFTEKSLPSIIETTEKGILIGINTPDDYRNYFETNP